MSCLDTGVGVPLFVVDCGGGGGRGDGCYSNGVDVAPAVTLTAEPRVEKVLALLFYELGEGGPSLSLPGVVLKRGRIMDGKV